MRRQHGYLDLDFGSFFAALILIGVVIGALLMWLVPLLWGWLKPLLHVITA